MSALDPNVPSDQPPQTSSLSPTGKLHEIETPYVSWDIDIEGANENRKVHINEDTAAHRNSNEMNDEDKSYAASFKSEQTQEGIHDPAGFTIICLVILVGDMARGVMFPTMWPLVESLGGTTVTLGYCVASFSFGRILVNPIFGAWSTTTGYSQTLTISMTILLLGTLLYTQVPNVGSTNFLIFAQIVLGIGSGTAGVTRAFVAEVTATRQRTTYMAFVTSVQYGGFAVTPFIGALFLHLFKEHDYQFGYVTLHDSYCIIF